VGKDVYFPIDVTINKVRYGSDYGGYDICPDGLNSESIIYSFGLGDDISFDLSLISNFGCKVFAYDPSPETKQWLSCQNLPEQFIYHDVGIGSINGIMSFYPSPNKRINYSLIPKLEMKGLPVNVALLRLQNILELNDHSHIDLLKMDIEGAEFDVLKDIIASGIDIRQIVLEFHHKHKELRKRGTVLLISTILLLKQNNYKIFAVSSGGIEYSFIKCA